METIATIQLILFLVLMGSTCWLFLPRGPVFRPLQSFFRGEVEEVLSSWVSDLQARSRTGLGRLAILCLGLSAVGWLVVSIVRGM